MEIHGNTIQSFFSLFLFFPKYNKNNTEVNKITFWFCPFLLFLMLKHKKYIILIKIVK